MNKNAQHSAHASDADQETYGLHTTSVLLSAKRIALNLICHRGSRWKLRCLDIFHSGSVFTCPACRLGETFVNFFAAQQLRITKTMLSLDLLGEDSNTPSDQSVMINTSVRMHWQNHRLCSSTDRKIKFSGSILANSGPVYRSQAVNRDQHTNPGADLY